MKIVASLQALIGLGNAEGGTDHWWGQRVSAAALLPLGLWCVVMFATLDSYGHADVVAFVAVPRNGILLSLLCVTLAYHSALGVQVVIEDYVHATGLIRASLIVSRIAHLVVALVAVYAVFEIGTGA
jgi:succinate dehydrogenase / fumarate reductase membrane anchor subunit